MGEIRADDDLETREQRGLCAFSLVLEDSNGEETLGMTTNDRITSYSELMKKDNLSRRNPLHHHIGWLSLLAMIVLAIAIRLTIH